MSAATRVRVTLTEWIGDVIPLVRNMHVSSLIAMVLMCDEVFGSVVSLLPYDDVDEVFRNISAGRFGLQTVALYHRIEVVHDDEGAGRDRHAGSCSRGLRL